MSPFGVFDAAHTAVRMIGRAAKVQAYEVALMASVAAMAPHDTWSAAASTPHAVRDRQSRRTPHPRRAPCCSCTALGGHEVQLVLARASIERPRADRRSGHLRRF
jgi:hypothetical protein